MFTKKKLFGMLLAFIATASWASFYVVSRFVFGESAQVADSVDPIFATFLRVAMGALFFIFMLLFTGKMKTARKALQQSSKTFLFLGLIGIVGEGVLVFWSTKYTTAARSSLCANLSPIFTVLIAWIFTSEKMTPHKIIGMLLGFGGILIAILGNGSKDIYMDSSNILGDLLAVASGICWAAYTVGGVKVTKRYGAMVSTALVIIIGAVMLWALIILTGRPMHWNMPLNIWLAYAYLGVIANGVSYLCWYNALKYLNAGELGAFGYISVMLTVIFSCIFLEEQIGLYFLIALGCVMSGVYMMMEKQKSTRTKKVKEAETDEFEACRET